VERAAKLAVPKEPKLKDPTEYRLIGKTMPRLDTPSKTNGTAEFGIDFHIQGMKYALLARCPTIGGKVTSFDDGDTRKVPGVTHVEKIGNSAVAVAANSVWSAMQGRKALKITWDDGPNKDLNTASIAESLKTAANIKGVPLYKTGDVEAVKGRRGEATYVTPLLAHAPMEPGNCFAHFLGTSCELWSPTQVPQDVRDSVATALGLKPENVRVNVTLMGGGFGRRLEHDYGVEAALVSKAINSPVQVLWTREDDMRFSTYRPPSFHRLSATMDANGAPSAFFHRIVSPTISGQKGLPVDAGVDPDLKDEASFLYLIPNINVDYVSPATAVPLGWLRSVYAAQVAFASECFVDELAVASGKDPLAYRLHMLAEDKEITFFDTKWRTDRLRGVLKLAAEKAEWDKPPVSGRHRGIAAFGCFGTYAAEVVEISMQNDEPKVERVVVAVDCGQVVNPNILEQQIYSAVLFGLSAALRGQITIEHGQVQQANFDTYPVVRMKDIPAIEAYFVESHEPPTGIGEPPVPPLAPALCNAIFAATRKRIRSLPILNG
jgi:isoquinoline 1-oxidoreductase beta subunit